MSRLIDIAAVVAAFSLLLYAFTGLAVWAPLPNGGEGAGRLMLILFAHGAPIIVALIRRSS